MQPKVPFFRLDFQGRRGGLSRSSFYGHEIARAMGRMFSCCPSARARNRRRLGRVVFAALRDGSRKLGACRAPTCRSPSGARAETRKLLADGRLGRNLSLRETPTLSEVGRGRMVLFDGRSASRRCSAFGNRPRTS
jgi:hypothetical protein